MKRDYTKAITWAIIGLISLIVLTKLFQIVTQ